MQDPSKTYQKLIEENSVLKQKIKELEQSEVKYKQAEEVTCPPKTGPVIKLGFGYNKLIR